MSNSGVIFQKIAGQSEIRKKIKPSLKQELLDYLLYFLRVFLTVAIVYVIIRWTIFDVIGISGKSMYPTYNTADIIYIDQLSPKFGSYQRGEVVVLKSPPDISGKRELFIKRVIGLPGERVVFEDGQVYIYSQDYTQGVLLNENFYLDKEVTTYKNLKSGGQRYEEKFLAKDEYFVMGDNRGGSADSRSFGPILKKDILGREFYRVLPPEKSGFYKLPKYNISN